MQIVRTIIWVLILFGILAFSFFNWETVEVTLWDNLVLETKIPALVIIAFLLGLVPMWLYHRSVKWSLSRRIRSLENSVKSNALSQRHEPAVVKPADKAVENPGEKPVSDGDTLSPAAPVGGDGGE
ncbi:MAG: LapA family protein [Pseudomonadota bacterium]